MHTSMFSISTAAGGRSGPERGTALLEWSLLVVLIAIVALVGVTLGGEEVSGQYSNIASSLASV